LEYIENDYQGEIVILRDYKNNLQSAIKNINLKYNRSYNYNLSNTYDYEIAKPFLPKTYKFMDAHVLPSDDREKIKKIIVENRYKIIRLNSLDLRFERIRNNI